MSQDEQNISIGKLSIERAECRRQGALLRENISSMASRCGYIDANVHSANPILDAVFAKVDEIERAGGLKKMQDWIFELRNLEQRISSITGTLRESGVD